MSLLCLNYLVKECNEQFMMMKRSGQEKEDFFVAISSVNLTSYMMSYLYMNQGTNMPTSHYRVRAGRPQFKTFCDLNAQSKSAFFVLHSLAFIHMFTLWRKLADANTGKLPPNFNKVIDQTIDALHRVMSG